jgi:hypothetical protein
LSQADTEQVIISNGEDFFEIPASDVFDALSEGFYLPRERGLTVISNGDEVFEIPVEDVADAIQDGFRDLIADPDGTLPAHPGTGDVPVERPLDPQPAPDGVSTTPEPEAASVANNATAVSPAIVSESRAIEQPAVAQPVAEKPVAESSKIISEPAAVPQPVQELVEIASPETEPAFEDVSAAASVLGDSGSEAVADPIDVEVEETEDPEAERRLELEEALLDAKGFDKLKLLIALHAPTRGEIAHFNRSYGVSILVHVVMLVLFWNVVFAAPDDSDMHVISSVLSDADLEAEEEGPLVEIDVTDEATESTDDTSQMENMLAVTQLADVDLSPETLKIDLDTGAGEPASADAAQGGGMTESGSATKGALGARSNAIAMYGGTPSSEAAVEASLDWLGRHQAADGGWGFNHSLTPGCDCPNAGTSEGRSGATGVALLTYFGAGYTFADGPRAPAIRKGLEFLLRSINVNEAGYGDLKGGDTGNGGIYQHGLGAAALCEALAVNRVLMRMIREDKTVRFIDPSGHEVKYKDLSQLGGVLQNACQLALNYLVYHQDAKSGGWGYQPKSRGDTSILGWQVMAMVSGRSENLQIPSSSWQGIANYLKGVSAGSGYAYSAGQPPKKSTTAIGLLCKMYTGGKRSDPRLASNVTYLSGLGPSRGEMYYNYYATQAMFAWGDEKGDSGKKLWTQWNDKMRDGLVATQSKGGHEQGSWVGTGHGQGGRHFWTCLAAMTLEIYYRKLPVYQRLSLEPIKLK